MSGSRTGKGASITYTFSWTGTNLDAIADAAARQIWINTATPTGYKTIAEYEALSIQQKVNILMDIQYKLIFYFPFTFSSSLMIIWLSFWKGNN